VTTIIKVESITELQRRAEALQALGATSLYLFGSVMRDEAKAASDLDLFIDYDRDGRFNEVSAAPMRRGVAISDNAQTGQSEANQAGRRICSTRLLVPKHTGTIR
jgi:hypothetical protein